MFRRACRRGDSVQVLQFVVSRPECHRSRIVLSSPTSPPSFSRELNITVSAGGTGLRQCRSRRRSLWAWLLVGRSQDVRLLLYRYHRASGPAGQRSTHHNESGVRDSA
jgi:hypothetical protein